jgi:hypothetical protein
MSTASLVLRKDLYALGYCQAALMYILLLPAC